MESGRLKTMKILKRFFDIAVSAVAILLLSPLLLLIAIAIVFDDGPPILFRQLRVGKGEKRFHIYKFRSMSTKAPSAVATNDLDDAYDYITRVGRILRKSSLDELPQLFNILKGDMSLVGPRPLIRQEREIYELRKREGVYAVRPGITGWAQINGRDNLSNEEKVKLDREYVDRQSLWFDIKILCKTVKVVLTGQGFSEGGGFKKKS